MAPKPVERGTFSIKKNMMRILTRNRKVLMSSRSRFFHVLKGDHYSPRFFPSPLNSVHISGGKKGTVPFSGCIL